MREVVGFIIINGLVFENTHIYKPWHRIVKKRQFSMVLYSLLVENKDFSVDFFNIY
jgi:hypothetical protein